VYSSVLVAVAAYVITRTSDPNAGVNLKTALLSAGLVLVAFAIAHFFRVPALLDEEHRNEKEKLQASYREALSKSETARKDAESRVYDGRPVLMFRVAMSQPNRTDDLSSVFRVTNCGSRPARWVTVRDVRSSRKNYLLHFGTVGSLVFEEEKGIPCAVGYPDSDHTLLDFLLDNDEDAAMVWFDVTLECRDTDESLIETMVRIVYDVRENILAVRAVPYTLSQGTPASQENLKLDAKLKELAAAAPAHPVIGSAEWLDLADRFKQVSNFMGVNLHTASRLGSEVDTWQFTGDAGEIASCEALCRRAGAMLLKSRRVSSGLSERVLSKANDTERWLSFLRDTGAVRYDGGPGREEYDGALTLHFLGSISGVALVSSRLCIECSSKEL
jgi:hypothetical protein